MVIEYYYFSLMITIKYPIIINFPWVSFFIYNFRVGLFGNWKKNPEGVHIRITRLCLISRKNHNSRVEKVFTFLTWLTSLFIFVNNKLGGGYHSSPFGWVDG